MIKVNLLKLLAGSTGLEPSASGLIGRRYIFTPSYFAFLKLPEIKENTDITFLLTSINLP